MPKSFAAALLAFVVLPTYAADTSDARARQAIQSLVPNAQIDALAPAPLPGFYEVVLGGQILYVSTDGRFLLNGTLYDVSAKRDLTEVRRSRLRTQALATMGGDKRIVFKAAQPKYVLSVFTDIDCGYCRRLHQEIAQYNKLGISVEYLLFPRAGEASESFTKAVSVWCADNQHEALTDAKAGKGVTVRSCPNPVTETLELGRRIGVTGTPAVVAADGSLLGGYLPPDQLLARLQALKPTVPGE